MLSLSFNKNRPGEHEAELRTPQAHPPLRWLLWLAGEIGSAARIFPHATVRSRAEIVDMCFALSRDIWPADILSKYR
jgi:hypothetical protein